MEPLHPHCAGLDVHKESVVACIRHMADVKVTTGVKTFKTTIALSDWHSAEGCMHIAMEATGIYWKPVWHIQAQYPRIRSRRRPQKAIGAVAASMLTAAYQMLKNGTLYQDLGANHFDGREKGNQVLRLENRLRSLGFAVQITSVAA